jgi:hypothetical protein
LRLTADRTGLTTALSRNYAVTGCSAPTAVDRLTAGNHAKGGLTFIRISVGLSDLALSKQLTTLKEQDAHHFVVAVHG